MTPFMASRCVPRSKSPKELDRTVYLFVPVPRGTPLNRAGRRVCMNEGTSAVSCSLRWASSLNSFLDECRVLCARKGFVFKN